MAISNKIKSADFYVKISGFLGFIYIVFITTSVMIFLGIILGGDKSYTPQGPIIPEEVIDENEPSQLIARGDAALEGDTKDIAEAVRLYKIAADKNSNDASRKLGWLYYKGDVTEKNIPVACLWFKKAAENDDRESMNVVGVCYENGEGFARDYGEAFYWYRRGAEKGDGDATFNIGDLYEHGRGVGKNINQAVLWYKKADALGSISAKSALQRLNR